MAPLLLGFERASRRDPFPSPSETLTSRPSPGLSVRVHALGLPLLFEVPSPLLPVAPRLNDHSCRGLFPLRGVTDGVHAPLSVPGPLAGCGRSQLPASLRPQAFSTSRRLAPSSISRACFIPRPRPGFVLPSRGFSRSAAVPGSSPGPAPLSFDRPRSPATRLPRVRPRLRGFDLRKRCVRPGRGLAFPSVAPLFGFLLLRALASPP